MECCIFWISPEGATFSPDGATVTHIPLPTLTQQPVGGQGVQMPSTSSALGPSGLRKGTEDSLQTGMQAAFQLGGRCPVRVLMCAAVWLQGNIHARGRVLLLFRFQHCPGFNMSRSAAAAHRPHPPSLSRTWHLFIRQHARGCAAEWCALCSLSHCGIRLPIMMCRDLEAMPS